MANGALCEEGYGARLERESRRWRRAEPDIDDDLVVSFERGQDTRQRAGDGVSVEGFSDRNFFFSACCARRPNVKVVMQHGKTAARRYWQRIVGARRHKCGYGRQRKTAKAVAQKYVRDRRR